MHNTENMRRYSYEKEKLSQLLFSSSKTVEEQFLLKHFTSEILDEVRTFIPFFTENDVIRILSCSDPTKFLYTIAEIIGRLRGEETDLQNMKKKIYGIAQQVCVLTTQKKK